MKTGKTLVQLAQELERQQNGKKDYIADTRELTLSPVTKPNESGVEKLSVERYDLQVNGHGRFAVTEHTHQQIAQRVGIPQKYYDRMAIVAPELLRVNVNHWFSDKPERRMIRTLDGNARAFLSDRYRPLDNFDLATAILPVLQEANGIKIESCEITDRRMYIKALFPKIEAEVKRGDVVQSGIVITNSEIGLGALKVEPLVFRLVCLNGMIAADYAQRKAHLGRAADEGEAAMELYRDETLRADDRAFWLKIADTVRAFAVDRARFDAVVQRMQAATENRLADPLKAVEVVTSKYQLNEGEKNGVLRHLIEGGDLSQFGLVNAITRAAQDVESYDRSTDMERLGGTVLELPRSEWEVLAKAA